VKLALRPSFDKIPASDRRAEDREIPVMDGIDRFWLKSYPADVPATIDESQIGTLVQLLQASFEGHGRKVAYTCMGADLSYEQMDRMSGAVASWLQSRGLAHGDRVAIMLPNVLQYPIVMAGILRAGCVVVNVNPLYTPRELQHQLADSGARAIFVLENFAATVAAVRDRVPTDSVCICRLGDLLGWARGTLVNWVVRHVRKLIPPYSLPGAKKSPVCPLFDVVKPAVLSPAILPINVLGVPSLSYRWGDTTKCLHLQGLLLST